MKKTLILLFCCMAMVAYASHTLPNNTKASAATPGAQPSPVATAAPAPTGVSAIAAATVAKAKSPYSATPTKAEKRMVKDAMKSYVKAAARSAKLDKANGIAKTAESKNQFLAIVLAFFLGGLAIHRVYLGAKPLMILWYIITVFGIFGLVPLIDFFVLIFNGTGSFEGSDKYFAW